jgi:hypothetical protein
MNSDQGTDGIAHTIHVADVEDGELTNFRKFENVLDAMNLPDGSVKFYFEGKEQLKQNARIVRSTVRGVKDAFRYRCNICENSDSDVISQEDRGDSMQLNCSDCGYETTHGKREMDDI